LKKVGTRLEEIGIRIRIHWENQPRLLGKLNRYDAIGDF
jgi:hypothetical protein